MWYYMLAACFLLAAFLLWKEWKRRNKKRLLIRCLASLLAIACLLYLAYPFKNTNPDNRTGKIIVLTDGYSPDSLKNFIANAKENTAIFTTDLSIAKSSKDLKTKFIADLSSFAKENKQDTVYVFGNGFDKSDLTLLNDLPFIYQSPKISPVISSIYWKQQVKSGEAFVIQGKYQNNSAKEIKISLQIFGEQSDSVIIPANTQKDFSLATIPKQKGRAVYSILASSGNDTLQNEAVPVDVLPGSSLKIFILSSSPDFEKTFLKNHLSQNGYEITSSTAISKGKKNEQFINMPQSAAELINPGKLEKFDLLITDDDAFSQLSSSQSAAVRSAIEENGMGLIIKISAEKNSPAFYSRFFPAFSLQQDKKDFSFLRSSLNDSDQFKIKIDEPVYLRYQSGQQFLLKDDQSNIYAANMIYGQGRIVATTLNNTYTLGLAGDNKSWQSLWSLLFDKAAKKINPGENWQVSTFTPFVNEPATLIAGNINTPYQGLVGDSKLYMKQDSLLPYQWQGTYWPIKKGWQSIIQENGKIQNWYAYDKNDWKALRDFQKISETKKYVSAHAAEFVQQSAGQSNNWTSHLKLYFVILFFVCCSILWVEQKLG